MFRSGSLLLLDGVQPPAEESHKHHDDAYGIYAPIKDSAGFYEHHNGPYDEKKYPQHHEKREQSLGYRIGKWDMLFLDHWDRPPHNAFPLKVYRSLRVLNQSFQTPGWAI